MQARDAAGRQVSLLNDDTIPHNTLSLPPPRLANRTASHISTASYSGSYERSPSPFPNTPELLRSDSYDSQLSNEPISPVTPLYDYGRHYVSEVRSPYESYYSEQQFLQQQVQAFVKQRAGLMIGVVRSASYEDNTESTGNGTVNTGKRYPCRYRDSHGCDKTFTTSGHASRHSKIHTAEKAVRCTFAGCTKKFTRADNMKQHLETHFKDKSRSYGASRPSLMTNERKPSNAKFSGSGKRLPAALSPTPGVGRPEAAGWDMRGLDALAMAVACQEGT